MAERDDTVEVVPITEQIEARVQDAVGEARLKPEPRGEPPRSPESLELEAIAPRPEKEKYQEPLLTALEVKRGLSRLVKLALVTLVLALVAAAFLAFTDSGRALLPKAMQKDAKKIAGEVENRARGVEDYYTFIDDQGVTHIVDDLEKVPEKFRARAKRVR